MVIGKKLTGKSTLVKDLLYHHRDLPIGTVISPTESCKKFYSEIMPSQFIQDEYTPDVIENFVKRQVVLLRSVNHNPNLNTDPRAFFVLDNCMFDYIWTEVNCFMMNARSYKVMFIITMECAVDVPPCIRSFIDHVFIFCENRESYRKRIYDLYAGYFSTFDKFCEVMDQCTDNVCLVIDFTAKSDNIVDQVFWYKAEQHDEFQIGAHEFWTESKECTEDDLLLL